MYTHTHLSHSELEEEVVGSGELLPVGAAKQEAVISSLLPACSLPPHLSISVSLETGVGTVSRPRHRSPLLHWGASQDTPPSLADQGSALLRAGGGFSVRIKQEARREDADSCGVAAGGGGGGVDLQRRLHLL